MLVGLSGPAITLQPGDEYPNCDPAEAVRLIEAGYAVPVGEPVERAVKDAPERRKRKK